MELKFSVDEPPLLWHYQYIIKTLSPNTCLLRLALCPTPSLCMGNYNSWRIHEHTRKRKRNKKRCARNKIHINVVAIYLNSIGVQVGDKQRGLRKIPGTLSDPGSQGLPWIPGARDSGGFRECDNMKSQISVHQHVHTFMHFKKH